ncbi:single-stranded-DNA-specific exonuclease RecJ [Virgibacillus sp. W0430]|uniref:single-stranded-DNA-specific exonuclease RecJ n=1 Tax=Virgibacillus sp. W0430 TaxID=3391580 RepID=UPI003F466D12
MLKSKANWQFIESKNKLQEQLDVNESNSFIGELLKQRGIYTEEAAHRFLNPNIENLQCPSNLAMINIASERVFKAVEAQEKILVFGDYDADGVCSTALLMHTLIELGANCDYYIPNRFTEGYGPNEEAFKKAANQGFQLIITVDTGIASVHEALIAKELGIDLIITDHHEIQDELPDALAIIHPKYSPEYTFKELAGVGVAFKFAQHLLGYFPEQFLDLVAIGTIADLVPLQDENRILAYYGLRALQTTKNIGLQALMKSCGIEEVLTEETIGFLIAPRINAVGRLQNAEFVVKLLLTTSKQQADDIAQEVNAINQERQQIVAKIVKEADKLLENEKQDGIIIVYKEGWNEGVLGIVASRLVQKYDRPTIVLTVQEDTGQLKGSARSIPAFNLFKSCMEIRTLFTHFGGHSQAAGMTFPIENLQQIKDYLNCQIAEQLTEEDFKQVIEVSKTVKLSEVNEQLVHKVNKLAPFGMKNPKPIFHINEVPAQIKQMGATKNHLKLQFKSNGQWVDGVGFRKGDLFYKIAGNTPVSIVGELGINEWNGNKKPQFIIEDIKVEEWQLFDHRGRKNRSELENYVLANNTHLLIGNEPYSIGEQQEAVDQLTYGAKTDHLQAYDTLFIFDLPPSLDKLREIINKTQPTIIHASYSVKTSSFLDGLPDRAAFKWLYAFLLQRKEIHLEKEQAFILKHKGWSKERLHFIIEVFIELGFISYKNDDILHLNTNIKKRNLHDSVLYRAQLTRAEIEEELYYSNYQQLKEWFSNCLSSVETPKEEVVYGF